MEELGDGHLTADEIAGLIGKTPAGIPAERAAHVSSCEVCRHVVAMYGDVDMRLQRLAGGPRGRPTDACPPVAEWAYLAAGLRDASRSDELLAHACRCDACGAWMRAVVEDFSAETTDAESASISTLESAQASWQHQMARRMAEASRRRVIPMRVPNRLAWAAGIVLTAGAGWLGWQQWISGDPERLIAQAYAQERPFEFRLPRAGYVPLRVERRGAGSSFQRPPALLEAEAKIAQQLRSDPESVKWLELRGRAEMVDSDPAAAVITLERALERGGGNPGPMADLGIAYALRAEVQNSAVDRGRAAEYLEHSLQSKPNSVETIFNLALVYGQMSRYEDAVREWRHYLEMDPAGAWREEAQRRLAEVEARMSAPRR